MRAAAQSDTRLRAVEKENKSNGELATQGERMLVTISFRVVKRGRKEYRYPRVNIPAEIIEKLGLRENTEAEIWVEERNGEKVIVIKPLAQGG